MHRGGGSKCPREGRLVVKTNRHLRYGAAPWARSVTGHGQPAKCARLKVPVERAGIETSRHHGGFLYGWTVRHRVGCGAYQIDLAVVDPNDDGRYVLAIEDDGRAYAGAPAARDRDRLRAQVLTQLGWRLHRVWAADTMPASMLFAASAGISLR